MKKIICVCILVILVFLLSGCMTKEVTLPNGERKKIVYNFYVILNEYTNASSYIYLTYDIRTNVCYTIITDGSRLTIVPYYNSNGTLMTKEKLRTIDY